MDHLLHPHDAAFPPVRVPYYYDSERQKYKYDGGSFTEYPDRCGFDKSGFISGDFSMIPSTDHNFFFQTWLFFGMIHEVLGADPNEFINHREQRVTTEKLPYWLAEWQRRLPCSRTKRTAERERVTKCLLEGSNIIAKLDGRKFRREGGSQLNEEVGFSIIVLGLTLSVVPNYGGRWCLTSCMTDEDMESMVQVGWPHSEFARKRLLEEARWCKSELSRLRKYMSTTGILYCGSMQHFGRTTDHSKCSEDRCAAEDIDEKTYETAHADGCKVCEHDGPNDDDISSASTTRIRRFGNAGDHSRCSDNLCVVENVNEATNQTVHGDGCKVCVHDGPEVAAIESVLAENNYPVIGLTKSESTSDICISVLPHCKSMAYTAITHVWADGLGNPHGNSLPKCQILRFYHLLQSSNRTSEGWATRVLAWMQMLSSSKTNTVYVWIDTLCIPLKQVFRKKAINLMYDVYNEAKTVLLLDRSLLSISAERPIEELCFRITASPWMRRAWTLQEGALAKTLLVQFADRTIDARMARKSIVKQTEGMKLYNMTLLESRSAIASVEDSGEVEDPHHLATVLDELIHRTTSHPEDKLICFAIMIRCDMKRITEVKGDERMQRVYQHLNYIPRSFLWQDGPTLDFPGFRWAPKNIFSDARGYLPEDLALSNRGLLVSAPGMVFFGRSHYMTTWASQIRDFTSGKQCILLIKDCTRSKWCYLQWRAGKSLNDAVGMSDAPWTILAVILQPNTLYPETHSGAVIRLDWNPSMATPDPQELSHYIRGCNQFSGEYIGSAQFDELYQDDYNPFAQLKVAPEKVGDIAEATPNEDRLEDSPQQQSQIIESGESIFFMSEGEMRGPGQEWCVT